MPLFTSQFSPKIGLYSRGAGVKLTRPWRIHGTSLLQSNSITNVSLHEALVIGFNMDSVFSNTAKKPCSSSLTRNGLIVNLPSSVLLWPLLTWQTLESLQPVSTGKGWHRAKLNMHSWVLLSSFMHWSMSWNCHVVLGLDKERCTLFSLYYL